jgi:4-alpha-glucanotransferase
MPKSTLDRLAEAHGVALSYIDEAGKTQTVSDSTKRGVLAALGVSTDDVSLLDAPPPNRLSRPRAGSSLTGAEARAFIPTWLEHGRAWGVNCQLYALRSDRNWGIGDFEDLARLAELMTRHGADFLGVNPLHALFLSDPNRFSPYSPSSRRFLNPLYIAVDILSGVSRPDAARMAALRSAELVNYAEVSALKRAALDEAFREFRQTHLGKGTDDDQAFHAYRAELGEGLAEFALFEALPEQISRHGGSAGWHDWPQDYKDRSSAPVADFRQQRADRVTFQEWLQWTASRQLSRAHHRAIAAGMRIGLYLDLAVGVAPDGADTWCAPDIVLAGARIGAPPDAFNAHGQNWGLAPLSPRPMHSGRTEGLSAVLDASMGAAGAVRLDHVMALQRLYLIPDGAATRDGTYVCYPLEALLAIVASASSKARVIVVGEDLGTVLPGFRDAMRATRIQGYRVLLFERSGGEFSAPHTYDRDALACVSTHDLPTLAGWWLGNDISKRVAIGLLPDDLLEPARAARRDDTRALMDALDREGLISDAVRDATWRGTSLADRIPDAVVVATHSYLARSPCRMVTVQLEDLVGAEEGVNIPGTIDEHPNWRRKLPASLELLADMPLFATVCATMSQERPRTS